MHHFLFTLLSVIINGVILSNLIVDDFVFCAVFITIIVSVDEDLVVFDLAALEQARLTGLDLRVALLYGGYGLLLFLAYVARKAILYYRHLLALLQGEAGAIDERGLLLSAGDPRLVRARAAAVLLLTLEQRALLAGRVQTLLSFGCHT